jgi:putative membrane protein
MPHLDLDLMLAILHHFFVFALFAILVAEFVSVRAGMSAGAVARVTSIDAWYGVLAGLVILIGFARAIFAAKGWDYYSHNMFFWAKIGTSVGIGLLSVPPTLAFLKWRRTGMPPADRAVASVRVYLWVEVALFAPLLACAAAMARGYGEF